MASVDENWHTSGDSDIATTQSQTSYTLLAGADPRDRRGGGGGDIHIEWGLVLRA